MTTEAIPVTLFQDCANAIGGDWKSSAAQRAALDAMRGRPPSETHAVPPKAKAEYAARYERACQWTLDREQERVRVEGAVGYYKN